MKRVAIGLWSEHVAGSRWANEGVSRVIGFLIEGAAQTGHITFRIVVSAGMQETVAEDLRMLAATEGDDWTVHAPEEGFVGIGEASEHARLLAEFANRNVPVEGWVVTFPFFLGALHLDRPKAVLFPDALPYDFPLAWTPSVFWREDGGWPQWRAASRQVLDAGDAVITFSKHVAQRHVNKLFSVPPKKIHVVPLAPPDLSHLLPMMRNRTRTVESRWHAAQLLRSYAKTRGWKYLQGFAFEDVPYVVVSTQDRPTKNIGRAAEAVFRMLRRDRINIKLITTAPFHFGADWTLLPGLVEREQMHRDVLSVTDLPRVVHAALFHCAAAAIHPSFFEGIVGALPFYEAVSVGTPCVMARGPHIAELLEEEPEIAPDTFDPYDIEALARLLRRILEDGRDEVLARQRIVYERLLSRRSWGSVAEGYANAALRGRPNGQFVIPEAVQSTAHSDERQYE